MVVSLKDPSAGNFLAEAIASLRATRSTISPEEERVLARLQNTEEGARAIVAMTDDVLKASRIILCCLEAENLCRNFSKIIDAEAAMIAPLTQLRTSVGELKRFISDLQKPPTSALEAPVPLLPGEAEVIGTVLETVDNLIRNRRRIAEETPKRLGATRNTKTELAGETAALGWLAEGVEHVTGSSNSAHAAVLGEITLGLSKRSEDHVTEDRIKSARKTRNREWRV